MSNLYLKQTKVDTPLGTWLQSTGSTNFKIIPKICIEEAFYSRWVTRMLDGFFKQKFVPKCSSNTE